MIEISQTFKVSISAVRFLKGNCKLLQCLINYTCSYILRVYSYS